jgi:uncharacterized protein
MRIFECVLLFVGVPIGIALVRWNTRLHTTPLVIFFLVVALILLLRDKSFDRRNLVRWEALVSGWKSILARFIPLALALALLFLYLKPATPLQYAREHTAIWLAFCLFAPVVPAYAEELLFRVFFFHRYQGLFPRPWMRITASAAVFSLAHLHLANPWALSLSFVGGLLFGSTYHRSRSAPLASLEHGLWIAYIFTLGLGPLFHSSLRYAY